MALRNAMHNVQKIFVLGLETELVPKRIMYNSISRSNLLLRRIYYLFLDQQNGKADKSKLGKKDKVEVKSKSEKTVVNSKKGKVGT